MSAVRTTILVCATAMPAFALMLFAAASVPCGKSNVLHEYQDLIAGLLALLGAGIGASYLQRQINLTKTQEQERLSRRHAAARAVMPLALDALVNYATDTAAALVNARTEEMARIEAEKEGTSSDFYPFDPPRLPDWLVRDIASMIEAAEPDDAQAFIDLLGDVQVQIARMRDMLVESDGLTVETHQMRVTQIEHRLYEATYIHAAAGVLFEYARRASNNPPGPPSWRAFETSLVVLSLFDRNQPALFKMYRRDKQLYETPSIVERIQRQA